MSTSGAWLGQTLRVTLIDDRILQGQFVAVDDRSNILLRYCESLEGSPALCAYTDATLLASGMRNVGMVTIHRKHMKKVELRIA